MLADNYGITYTFQGDLLAFLSLWLRAVYNNLDRINWQHSLWRMEIQSSTFICLDLYINYIVYKNILYNYLHVAYNYNEC